MKKVRPAIHGVLRIDKPRGLSSFDVIRQARHALGIRKIGHTGTLDPMATGLLVLVLGQATRLAPFIVDSHKRYTATVTLGVETNTYDAEGEVVSRMDSERIAVDNATLETALNRFRGDILQRPPQFSAIKVDGKRAYARARSGEDFDLPKRPVCIHQLHHVGGENNERIFDIRCSKGTYIRSFASDLGSALGVGAHLSGLRRTEVGGFGVEGAVELAGLKADPEGELRRALSPMVDAVSHLSPVEIPKDGIKDLRNGQTRILGSLTPGLHRAMTPDGELLAILEAGVDGMPTIKRGFPPPST